MEIDCLKKYIFWKSNIYSKVVWSLRNIRPQNNQIFNVLDTYKLHVDFHCNAMHHRDHVHDVLAMYTFHLILIDSHIYFSATVFKNGES